jgi:hypothetical protein
VEQALEFGSTGGSFQASPLPAIGARRMRTKKEQSVKKMSLPIALALPGAFA